MMGKLIQFPKSRHKTFPITSLLEMLLERAQRGELKFLAVAALEQDGNAFSAWTPEDLQEADLTSAIGAVSFLHARFMDNVVTGAEEDLFSDPPEAA
jgi:hypothetical protein